MTSSSLSAARALGALSATAIATLALAACGSDDDAGTTTAAAAGAGGAPAATKVACPSGGLSFGVEPFEDPAKLTPAYTTLAAALSKKLGCEVKVQIVTDYTAEVLAMQNGKLDIAQFGPLGYVFADRRAKAEAVASFADASGKLTTYTGGIWVPKDSPIQTVADLKGKSLVLSEPGSTSGDAIPRKALKDAGLSEQDVKIDYAGGHPEALLALSKGKADAAEVNSQTQATAEGEGEFDASKYREIFTSDPIPNDPVTVRGDLDPSLKQAIVDGLTGLGAADVAKVGKFLDVDPPGPLTKVTKDTYKPLFDLADTLGLTEKDV